MQDAEFDVIVNQQLPDIFVRTGDVNLESDGVDAIGCRVELYDLAAYVILSGDLIDYHAFLDLPFSHFLDEVGVEWDLLVGLLAGGHEMYDSEQYYEEYDPHEDRAPLGGG